MSVKWCIVGKDICSSDKQVLMAGSVDVFTRRCGIQILCCLCPCKSKGVNSCVCVSQWGNPVRFREIMINSVTSKDYRFVDGMHVQFV